MTANGKCSSCSATTTNYELGINIGGEDRWVCVKCLMVAGGVKHAGNPISEVIIDETPRDDAWVRRGGPNRKQRRIATSRARRK